MKLCSARPDVRDHSNDVSCFDWHGKKSIVRSSVSLMKNFLSSWKEVCHMSLGPRPFNFLWKYHTGHKEYEIISKTMYVSKIVDLQTINSKTISASTRAGKLKNIITLLLLSCFSSLNSSLLSSLIPSLSPSVLSHSVCLTTHISLFSLLSSLFSLLSSLFSPLPVSLRSLSMTMTMKLITRSVSSLYSQL